MALEALEAFAAAGYGHEAAEVILYGAYSNQDVVAQHVRKILSRLSATEAPAMIAPLINVLENDLSAKRRIAAMRALAAIGPPAEPALELLKEFLSKKDWQERIAAATAIKKILGKDQYQKPVADEIGKELGITAVRSGGVWAVVPREDSTDSDAFNKFNDAVIEEQERLFPPEETLSINPR